MTEGSGQLPQFDPDELWWSWLNLGPFSAAFHMAAEFCLGHPSSLTAAMAAGALKLDRRYGVFLADLRSFAACAITRNPPEIGGLLERRLFSIAVFAPTSCIARLAIGADIGVELTDLMHRHGLVSAPGSRLAIWPWPSTPLAVANAHPDAVRQFALRLGDTVPKATPPTLAAAAMAFDAVDGGSDPTLAPTISRIPGMSHCLLFGVRVARFAADCTRPTDWLATGRSTEMGMDRWMMDAAALFGPGSVVQPPLPLDQSLLKTACLGVRLALEREASLLPDPSGQPDEIHVYRDEVADQVEVAQCWGDIVRGPVHLPWGLVATGFAEFLDHLADNGGVMPILHRQKLHRATLGARRRGRTAWDNAAD